MEHTQHAVHVWPGLQPWWNYAANFTSLFEWKAIAAIGTFIAVAVALRRDDRSEKMSNLKERALLLALCANAEALAEQLRDMPHSTGIGMPKGYTPDEEKKVHEFEDFERLGIIDICKANIDAIKPTDLSDKETVQHWMVVKASLRFFESEMAKSREGKRPLLQTTLDGFTEAGVGFKQDADRLFRRSYPLTHRLRAALEAKDKN